LISPEECATGYKRFGHGELPGNRPFFKSESRPGIFENIFIKSPYMDGRIRVLRQRLVLLRLRKITCFLNIEIDSKNRKTVILSKKEK
jgi:hypothetical protein